MKGIPSAYCNSSGIKALTPQLTHDHVLRVALRFREQVALGTETSHPVILNWLVQY